MPKGVFVRSKVSRQDSRRLCWCGGRFQDSFTATITHAALSLEGEQTETVDELLKWPAVMCSPPQKTAVWKCNRCGAEKAV